jgi:hypothetical protein
VVNIVWGPNINEWPGKARKTKNIIQFCSNEGQERQREKSSRSESVEVLIWRERR